MIAYGLACVLTFMLTAWANADSKGGFSDALGAVTLLCVSYGVTNMLVAAYGMPNAALGFPIVDFIFMAMVWRAWKREKCAWKVILAMLFVAQLTAHVGFIYSWYTHTATQRGLYLYIVFINGTFALQLLAVGSAGVRHGMARFVGYLLDRRRTLARAHG